LAGNGNLCTTKYGIGIYSPPPLKSEWEMELGGSWENKQTDRKKCNGKGKSSTTGAKVSISSRARKQRRRRLGLWNYGWLGGFEGGRKQCI
jgi:hypothetical protein